MKKKLFSILLSFAMVITMMPAMPAVTEPVYATETFTIKDSSGATLTDGPDNWSYMSGFILIEANDASISGTVDQPVQLDRDITRFTLNGVQITTDSTMDEAFKSLRTNNTAEIVVKGTNSITQNGNQNAIYADNLNLSGDGVLTATSNSKGICGNSVTINMAGTLNVNGAVGIECDNLTIPSTIGTVTICGNDPGFGGAINIQNDPSIDSNVEAKASATYQDTSPSATAYFYKSYWYNAYTDSGHNTIAKTLQLKGNGGVTPSSGLTVTKADGTEASEGSDYDWDTTDTNQLIIKSGNLIISGTTTDKYIQVDASVSKLTLKDFSCSSDSNDCLCSEGNLELEISGNCSLITSGKCKDPVNVAGILRICGSGNLVAQSICEINDQEHFGIYTNDKLYLDITGNLLATGVNKGIYADNGIEVSGTVGTIIARCGGKGLQPAAIFWENNGMTLNRATIKGSTASDTPDDLISDDVILNTYNYKVKVGTSTAYSVKIEGSHGAPIPGTFTQLEALADNATTGAIVKLGKDYEWTEGDGNKNFYVNGSKTLTLDLNGHTLSSNHKNEILYIEDGKLILTDSSSNKTGKIVSTNTEELNYTVLAGGTFEMQGGTITGCSGNCVIKLPWDTSVFEMSGGKITNNNCTPVIIDDESAYVIMTGGEITKNNDDKYCGGIYGYTSKNVYLGGNAVVYGNTSKGKPSNVHLINDGTYISRIRLGTGANVKDYLVPAPTSGFKVGVCLYNEFPNNYGVALRSGQITSNGTSGQENYFISDDPDRYVAYNNSGYLEMKEPASGYYKVNINSATNGDVVSDKQIASKDEKVTLTAVPEEGYELSALSYNDGSDHDIFDNVDEQGECEITMPEHAITVTATFVKSGPKIKVKIKSGAVNPVYNTALSSYQLFEVTANGFETQPSLELQWKKAGEENDWTGNAPTGVTLGTDGKVTTTAAAPAGNYVFRITNGLDDGAEGFVSSGPITLTIEQLAENAPVAGTGYTIDYGTEKLTASANHEVSSTSGDAATALSSDAVTPGKTYYVRKVASDANHKASAWTEISVPARPAAPAKPTLISMTDDTIVVDADLNQEYSIDNGATWVVDNTDGTTDEKVTFSNLTPGQSYSIVTRTKAVASVTFAFASNPSEALVVQSAPVCEIDGNEYYTIQEAISSCEPGKTITLIRDVDIYTSLTIPAGKTVVIDLNGMTLDRGLQEATDNGAVIYVDGDLTIKDTSANPGKIMGGYSSNLGGGGICVKKGSLKLESGEIVNNKSKHSGGGVFIAEGAKFIMSGGKISGNHTDKAGGGVFCFDDFTMSDGEISNNTSTLNGAGVYAQGISTGNRPATKHFTMTGGTIKNNVSSRNGGGVYVDNYDMDAIMTGGMISNNSADAIGGGVCANSDITLGGSIIIKDNTVNEKASNVYLRNKEKSQFNPVIIISSAEPLEIDARIGVTLQAGIGIITKCENDVSNYFFLDATGEKPVYDSSSKQLVSNAIKVTTIDELLAAIEAADTNNEYTIVLGEDINENQQITITGGRKIILDLNGHKLKRTYNVTPNPSMIYVASADSLTIKDSSGDKKGEICSGDSQYGAAIWNEGTVVFESGNINDCHAQYTSESNGFGGAVYNRGEYAKFTMTGGTIKNCDAKQYGGAIFNFQGTVTISGGTIENCQVTNTTLPEPTKAGLGGAIWNNNKLTISGGTIQNCKSAYAGGAIFNDGRKETLGKGRDSVFTMTGGTIKDCGSASENAENKPNTEIIYLRNSKMTMSNSAEIVGGIYTNNKPMATSDSACQIDISGGKFNGTFSSTPSASACAISIIGGKFSADPTSYVSSGYKVYDISESPYIYEVVKDNGGGGGGSGEGETTDEPTPGTPTTVDVTKEVTVEKTETGETTATVDVSKKATDIVAEAKEKKSKEVIIDAVAKTTEEVDKADVIIPAKLFEDLSNVPSVENIVIQTNVAELTFDKETAKEIAAQSPDGAVITVEAIREDEESTKLSQDVYELKVVAKTATGEQIISNFKGGKVTVKVDIPTGLAGKTVACLYRNNKGVYTRRSVTNQNDKDGWFSFTTNHFSDYVVTEESAAQKILVNQVKPTQNKLKAYKGKKVRVSFKRAIWDKELGKKISDYQVYRSTKKSKGFKKVATLKKKTSSTIKYFNKKGLKKGKKYYYKVRGRVKLSNGEYAYTKCSSVRSVRCK